MMENSTLLRLFTTMTAAILLAIASPAVSDSTTDTPATETPEPQAFWRQQLRPHCLLFPVHGALTGAKVVGCLLSVRC